MESSSAPRKRRRATSLPSSPNSSPPTVTRLPDAIINPLSHTPGSLKQLLAAGLTEHDRLPSLQQPGFPHRPYRDATRRQKPRRWKAPSTAPVADTDTDAEDSRAETDFETEAESGHESSLSKPQSYAAERAALQPLARSIAVFLARGDILAAKRAFGLLMRSRVSGKPVDIRRNHYWELGAEILMREPVSEENAAWAPTDDSDMSRERRRKKQQHRYPISNVPQVKEYFQGLIRNYPHHLGARKAASALQFWPAQVSYEISQMHAQHTAALDDLRADAESWEMDPDMDMYNEEADDEFDSEDRDPFNPDGSSRGRPRGLDALVDAREKRMRQARDEIRTKTLDGMRDLASRMDKILDSPPFSRSPELQRLRGIVSLYIADLLVPADCPHPEDRQEAEAKKLAEGEIAIKFFRTMEQLGGKLDHAMHGALDMDREGSEGPTRHTFASLPIRDHRVGG
ncbi:hypothetical protein HYQ45_006911 [Verticillium longisporum]|uniref:Uncharacterized protein n=1 Tax=Verticillium longisporum TaxID=100787 RepID=A0A8I2ZR44_VERLO|nr:hypothetical protein HYQ44_009042 [Verticillium longisporum]KAG7135192.1 hypothetical protein HYQ45_006911 [Verticillium longisporum]